MMIVQCNFLNTIGIVSAGTGRTMQELLRCTISVVVYSMYALLVTGNYSYQYDVVNWIDCKLINELQESY